jgi:hypothetical protein
VPEPHPARRLELDDLDGASGVEVDLRVMRCDHEPVAARQHVDPGAARGPAYVRRADDLEHEVSRRLDLERDRAERVNAASPPEVEGQPSHREEEEGACGPHDQERSEHPDRDPEPGCGDQRSHRDRRSPYARAACSSE